MPCKSDSRSRNQRRGSSVQRAVTAAFRILLEDHIWRRHPAPFNKTDAGRARRAERRFVRRQDMAVFS